jgi:four helix bundle protein
MGDVELRRFVRISLGSLSELECGLLLAERLDFVKAEGCRELTTEIGSIRGMLQKLHRTLPTRRSKAGSMSHPLDPRP